MPAANLVSAAELAYSRLIIRAAANQFSSALSTFAIDVSVLFPEQIPLNRPVGNWLIPIRALAATSGARGTLALRSYGTDLIFRICYATEAMFNLGLITAAQHTGVLTAYNAHIF